jgi:predicted transposase YdaD
MKLTALLAQERREGREEGVKQGEERFAVKMTIKMLKEGNSMEKIAKFLELPLQKVREIAQQNNLI